MTMCRVSARQITNPCTSAQSYWSNNTIEPPSNNYETKHFRNCKQGIVTARRAYRSAGRRLRSENSCTRRNDVTRSKLQISGRIMRTCVSSRATPTTTCLRPSFTSDLSSRSFRREKHKPSQSNSIWTCQRNDFSRRQTASWTKWSPSESTRTTTTTFTSQAISSPPPSAPVWRRWCVVSSQVDFLVFLPRSSVRGDGR